MRNPEALPAERLALPAGPRGRFAPSPTGNLHFGSLVAALGSWLHARSGQGSWIVRMEDIDSTRSVPGAGQHILATLAAFGLESDEPVVWQSQRLDLYQASFERLQALGVVYPCQCSRSDLTAFNGIHPYACVRSANSSPPAWRVRVGDREITFTDRICARFSQRLDREVGDFVVRRADGLFTYQLAVVVDDDAQGINEIVRGADLLDSTPRQIHLQELLGLPTPGYLHLPLVLDPSGRKLSKQEQARPVDAGDPLPALQAALAFLGQRPPASKRVDALLREAVDAFDIDAIPARAPAHAAMRKD
ncbi:MAG: tRNA glutamyl-Q(34) synthetase GluQRS [Dokdonella sp.]|uniref:tRNA glutamyl-Q(34) synthetase GluQRS n=1 Tax=Dokdonella sp. TaxID=2291710 RepID=UPI002CDA45E7|nr:tRNA glutamyl-Q(34) synthetase GluQRS [Xanthomonadales bacterium]MBL0223512.1 tRNA glutamyl-Q(34) synthetase GluQRS [Xanthomonadales bacterium]HQW77150.1 tRNA glutamyl-Q(34) synthetase GluQRS [Dokdonella sp.]HQX65826.1 tRNA glutamyl-Q(34) synthetase GluQRS [Dokdonella sp.]HQY55320.1 tRNA glutamyl-Q(34) synthetase GluQRS [Dokdonella sp.]